MKPLIYLLTFIFFFVAANAYASCASCNKCKPDSCEHVSELNVKVNYRSPVVFCKYAKDDNGKFYTICYDCYKHKCVKEYFFDNYCDPETRNKC